METNFLPHWPNCNCRLGSLYILSSPSPSGSQTKNIHCSETSNQQLGSLGYQLSSVRRQCNAPGGSQCRQ